ncbi:hypothetical protein CC85DRAFT_299938 [Cutaneotrichosporon oleaginosum]|uniref:Mid2 domain-containing protein n=1 Tax=Cutaneotrichosporon oleaginosum TaxID=879819 RepID=A0A0J0XVJ1_9TREE|nr:uncharacterized protein CC85DRAFT_299938 [Cutaneotrichosporon oleaginosum]KLT45068.1 hypothetical protein CC85DRAFT_299938 [Cutaneotrichosporon oleaginosum]TXT09752.1 hypothetical protein COLE_03686 [Cutaneotrichosporon oleaginosum]
MATPSSLLILDTTTTATITSWTTVAVSAPTATTATPSGCGQAGCERASQGAGVGDKSGMAKGKVAGVAVGCTLGALVVLGAVALLWVRARKRRQRQTPAVVEEAVVVVEDRAEPPAALVVPPPRHISLGREGCYTPVQYEGEDSYVYHPPSNSSRSTLSLMGERRPG